MGYQWWWLPAVFRSKWCNSESNQWDDVTFEESQSKFDENKSWHVLRVEWNTENNEFVFRFSNLVYQAKSLVTSKRNVLKINASFYVPLGIISPVTARVKTIFQLQCQDKLDHDDSAGDYEQFRKMGNFKDKTICIF